MNIARINNLCTLGAFIVLFHCGSLSAFEYSNLHHFSRNPASEKPQVFKLPRLDGLIATERLVINADYTEIVYSLVDGYEPDSQSFIRRIIYQNSEWQAPVTIAKEFNSPAMSLESNTLYVEGKNDKDVWFINKHQDTWQKPKKLVIDSRERHYFTQTLSGNAYYSSLVRAKYEVPVRDFFVVQKGKNFSQAVALNLAMPSVFPRDFFIAKDESYLITLIKAPRQIDDYLIGIYFKQSDGSWSEPQSLGNQINETPGAWKWGFYVTDDNRYFFFTSGNEPNDTHIYYSLFENRLAKLRSHINE